MISAMTKFKLLRAKSEYQEASTLEHLEFPSIDWMCLIVSVPYATRSPSRVADTVRINHISTFNRSLYLSRKIIDITHFGWSFHSNNS